jgi:hypothetical protein
MCDYSLHLVRSRPAQVADQLVTTKFAGSITRGFAAVADTDVAVCLRPGTELVFDKNVEYDNFIGVLPNRKVEWNTARFRQVDLDNPHAHHDALEFPDGKTILITRLSEGQHAIVLQLPARSPAPGKAHDRSQNENAGRALLGSP